ncbi:universal stress protein [Shewanella carassii]|uniref:Universal stress protein A n=1 Tax=Shewanella carassii TaxID=1987584 RepID=A0ABQ1T297_9GAMM|nr:universal stress protein [Shewanella carassii]GGE70758.1 universal stress protein A [Shewanella carassii]
MRTRQILCPVDFSEESEHALEYAIELAALYKVKLRLLHVISKAYGEDITTLPHHEENFGIVAVTQEQLDKHMKAYASQKIHSMLQQLHPEQQLEVVIRRGSATGQILEEAESADVGMIVIGCHRRTALAHWLQPSVAEEVINKAKCPVMVVK